MSAPAQELAALSTAFKKRRPRALFFDIDDTLTTHGRLTADAYSALCRAAEHGILCVPITGRPAGWCDHIARSWPVAGVVGENGALAMWHDGKKLRRLDVLSEAERRRQRVRLNALGAEILKRVRGSKLASDQAYREYDLAIDFCEDTRRLSGASVARIVSIFEDAGCTAKVSSIHVNGWFGRYDKLSMTRRLMTDVLKLRVDARCRPAVFVGDSPNDQPMFEAFAWSVGVANVRDFELEHPPAFVCTKPRGAGFAELAECLLPHASV